MLALRTEANATEPLPSVLQSHTHNFPCGPFGLTPVALDKIELAVKLLGRREHGDPALLPPHASILAYGTRSL